jgi:hypothetical protein
MSYLNESTPALFRCVIEILKAAPLYSIEYSSLPLLSGRYWSYLDVIWLSMLGKFKFEYAEI